MNKSQLASKVAESAGLTQKQAEAAVNSVFGAIEEALAAKEKVQVAGFGTFETRPRAERTGRNPQTGEAVVLPATVVAAFKAGNALKEAVRG